MKDIHKNLIKLNSLLMLIGIQNIHKNDAIYIYWIAAVFAIPYVTDGEIDN